MKKSIILPLTGEELIELQRILLDSDTDGAKSRILSLSLSSPPQWSISRL